MRSSPTQPAALPLPRARGLDVGRREGDAEPRDGRGRRGSCTRRHERGQERRQEGGQRREERRGRRDPALDARALLRVRRRGGRALRLVGEELYE